MEFRDLAKIRHSAIKFKKGVTIPEDDFRKIYESVQFTPSVFNLQPTKFIVVTDPQIKDMIYKLSYEQYKLHTASAIVIVVSKLRFDKDVHTIYDPMFTLGMLDVDDYNLMVKNINDWSAMQTDESMELESQKNAMLGVATWLYASKELGWDTCPMHIHNYDKLCRLLKIPNGAISIKDEDSVALKDKKQKQKEEGYLPVTMIAMGKANDEKVRFRGYRKPFSQAVTFNKF